MLSLGLENKVAVITGASDGLGRAAAERLATEGVKLAICARRKEHLENTARSITEKTGVEVLAQVADVTLAPIAGPFTATRIGLGNPRKISNSVSFCSAMKACSLAGCPGLTTALRFTPAQ